MRAAIAVTTSVSLVSSCSVSRLMCRSKHVRQPNREMDQHAATPACAVPPSLPRWQRPGMGGRRRPPRRNMLVRGDRPPRLGDTGRDVGHPCFPIGVVRLVGDDERFHRPGAASGTPTRQSPALLHGVPGFGSSGKGFWFGCGDAQPTMAARPRLATIAGPWNAKSALPPPFREQDPEARCLEKHLPGGFAPTGGLVGPREKI